jgi:hypothetical protein
MCVNWASSTWQAGTVNTAMKQKHEEEGGKDKSKIHTEVTS